MFACLDATSTRTCSITSTLLNLVATKFITLKITSMHAYGNTYDLIDYHTYTALSLTQQQQQQQQRQHQRQRQRTATWLISAGQLC
jgi:hypothetical protein